MKPPIYNRFVLIKRILSLCLLTMMVIPSGAQRESTRKLTISPDQVVQSVLKRVVPSVVGLWFGEGDMLTGTIISNDGLVVTCAHIPIKVGDVLQVGLQDGRKVNGKLISKLPKKGESNIGQDLALVQITKPGSWPAAPVAEAAQLTLESPVLAIGYPDTMLYGQDRSIDPLYVRMGHPIVSAYALKPGEICTSISGVGGDSGGPLFDLQGNLIGVCHGGDPSGAHMKYTRIDALKKGWNRLAPGKAYPSPFASKSTIRSFDSMALSVAKSARSSVVEVHSQERWIGFGCVVGDGLILTKASELGPNLTVILDQSNVAIVEVAAVDPALDLALLRLAYAPEMTKPLSPIKWAPPSDLPAGTRIAVVTPFEFTPLSGITSFKAREVPPIAGAIPCSVKDAVGGVEITEIIDSLLQFRLRRPFFPLRVGDIITHIEDIPIPNRDTFVKLMYESALVGTHPRVAGEPVQVEFIRNGKNVKAMVTLEYDRTPSTQLVRPASYRYSGFRSVIATDLPIRPEHCGAPVVDSQGRFIGLLIARAPFLESLILPAREVASSIERMKKSLGSQ